MDSSRPGMIWISLILFLIFLGGILVMFIYVSSLRANEKFAVDLTDDIVIVLKLSSFM